MEDQLWNQGATWQPFPIHADSPEEKDPLLKPTSFDCPIYDKLFTNDTESYVNKLKQTYAMLFKFLGNVTGYGSSITFDNLLTLSSINREIAQNMTQPAWVSKVWPEYDFKTTLQLINEISNENRVREFNLRKLYYLRGGYILGDWLKRAKDVVSGNQKEPSKMVLYSAHEGTLLSLMYALQINDNQPIPYAATIVMEIWKNDDGEYEIELFYIRNQNLISVSIPGCEKICPFQKLYNLRKKDAIFDEHVLYRECGLTYCDLGLPINKPSSACINEINIFVLIFSSLENTPQNPEGKFGWECLVGQQQLYNPSTLEQVPWFNVSLDEDPTTRWNHVVTQYVNEMNATINTFKSTLFGYISVFKIDPAPIWAVLMSIMKEGYQKLQEPYKSELGGMAKIAGFPIEEVFILNLFYEISAACTSIVAQDPNGHVYHGRNLDFGMYFMWNAADHQWLLTDNLRTLNINVNFIKDGKILFKGVTFAGHSGILTGVKPGGFSVSIDERDNGGSFKPLIDFFINGPKGRDQVLYALRDVMSNANTFDEAIEYFSTVPLYVGGYFIVGGPSPNQGAIVTRSFNETLMVQAINNITATENWYVLQTNYDWNQIDDYMDQRTIPGRTCMNKLGQKNVGFPGLFQVLSSKSTLNKATVHSSIMDIQNGILETYIQRCQDCWIN
uniref:ceramidase n=1 Tax=Acrobeloides nanus TaxID=290746 RepID=A0A914D1R7_9BILA